MKLGKRGRPASTRAAAAVTFDVGIADAEAPPYPRPAAVVGGEFSEVLSPGYSRKGFSGSGDHVGTADFLRSCGLCHRRLAAGRDIYMYRGDAAFCSLECREQQMKRDERKERRKGGETGPPEVVAAATEAETVAAA